MATALAATAAGLIAAQGAPVVFTRVDAGTYDPATNTTTGGGTQTAASVAVARAGDDIRDRERFSALGLQRTASLTLVVAAAGLAFAPQAGDRLAWAGADWTVREVEPVAPDGTALLWRVWGTA